MDRIDFRTRPEEEANFETVGDDLWMEFDAVDKPLGIEK